MGQTWWYLWHHGEPGSLPHQDHKLDETLLSVKGQIICAPNNHTFTFIRTVVACIFTSLSSLQAR